MSQVLITPELFNNLNYDMDKLNVSGDTATVITSAGDLPNESTVLIVFSNSDINAAIYHLGRSLEAPWKNKAIATVLVQESLKKDFIEKLQEQLKPYDQKNILNNTQFTNALTLAKKLNAQIIGVTDDAGKVGPTLVCDFTHDHFGSSQPTGLVTLHTFRTAKEAISLVSKESINFAYASIWHENHAYAYEVIAALKSSIFFINCYHVSMTILEESITQGKSFVAMDKSYHYETMPCGGLQKSIVFPIGSIFAN